MNTKNESEALRARALLTLCETRLDFVQTVLERDERAIVAQHCRALRDDVRGFLAATGTAPTLRVYCPDGQTLPREAVRCALLAAEASLLQSGVTPIDAAAAAYSTCTDSPSLALQAWERAALAAESAVHLVMAPADVPTVELAYITAVPS
jgi:hypothetical protein